MLHRPSGSAGLALAACLALAAPADAQDADRLLGSVFSDHMVVQRGAPVRIWGEAGPGETVDVFFDGARRTAQAGPDGAWSVSFPAREAGGPYDIAVETGGGAMAELSGVLVGDVWLCSGQSNMEYPVYRALNPDREIAGPHSDTIRLLTVPHDHRPQPLTRHAAALDWQRATPDSVRDFSAVCFFTGRELQAARPDVPLGLIDASWGGSRIEAWIGADRLRETGSFDSGLDLLNLYADDPTRAAAQFGETWQANWQAAHGTAPWASPGADWSPVPGLSDYRTWDDPEVRDHLGMIWYTATFNLTAEQAGQAASLHLGGVDEVDATWVNGQFAGYTFGWGTPRHYTLPAGLLRPGENTLLVNVLNGWGAGGMTGPADRMRLEFDTGERVPIGTGWRYRVAAAGGAPARAPWESVGGLTTIHNGMVAPLGPIGLTGALWYQGESNTGRPGEYQDLLHTLLSHWRDQFGEGLPVFIVQLPDFGALQSGPVDSGWAGVREAQRQVALADPDAGLAVAIDLGDRFDIHPPNKQAVAARLVRSIESQLYGGELPAWGANPASVERADARIEIAFEGTGGGLAVIGNSRPAGFELCDSEGCVFADAELDGTTVILTGDAAAPATYIRYCWADAPICNLYDTTGLPVGPFEEVVD
ncbi:sialate O-acetylesterase [Maricaulis sp.]|uniref:sialate O-acetylesterase n=1 Tax=Maricaulis sp. TaxID=1486257 RepID=UPI002614192E|nr:sialate O-acetylesterase [Maricaulis sp.]